MRYTLKKATGLFRIRRITKETDPMWRPWWGDWQILKQGTTIPRDTVRPFSTFADIYRAFHAFNIRVAYDTLETAVAQEYREEFDD